MGLWKDAQTTPAQAVAHAVNATGLARDPVRPFVYVTDGGDSLRVFNAHTAALVRTIGGVGTQLGTVAIAPDGGHAYVLDNSVIRVVDLGTDTLSASWSLPSAILGSAPLLVIHPNGEDVVLASNGVAMAHGVVVATTDIQGALAATDDGGVVYSMTSYSPSTITAWLTSYSNANAQLYATQAMAGTNEGGSSFHGEQIAVAGDGSYLYIADYTGGCMRVDPVTLDFVARFTSPGPDPTSGVAVGASGNVACGYSPLQSDGDPDIGVFSPSGTPLASFSTPSYDNGLGGGLLVASADGLVSVGAVAGIGDLIFVPMGAPSSVGGQGLALSVRGHDALHRQVASGSSPRR